MLTTRGTQENHESTAFGRTQLLTGAAVAILCSLFFFLLYWNRFAGLRSGNGSFEGGITILEGFRPYRDYFTAGPPLNALISASVMAIFGKTLVVIRAYGVFERFMLAAVLYFWLARLFRFSTAALATIVTMVISAGDPSDTLSSYNFAAILFGSASGFAASFFIDQERRGWQATLFAVAAGILAGMAFATKQTIGVGATVAVPVLAAACAWKLSGVRKASLFLAAYSAGWLLAAGAVLWWLAQLGILHEFFVDVFIKGPSAKASHPFDFVVRTARATYYQRLPWITGCVFLLLLLPSLRRSIQARLSISEKYISLWKIGIMSVASIGFGAFLSYRSGSFPFGLPNYPLFYGFYGCGLLGGVIAVAGVRRKVSAREAQLFLLAGVSFAIAFMLSLSWPALDGMLYPGLGLVLAATIDGLTSRRLQYVVYSICAVLLAAETCDRLNRPQGFHEWVDPPVREATATSTLPELSGLRLPPSVVRFLDTTVNIIRQHSTPSDTIFVYPEIGILYELGHRHWPTRTTSHNIDVVNDDFAREEAQRLVESRPAVLIYYRVPELDLHSDEVFWRRGKPSGQRDIIKAMETLVSQYHLAGTFEVPPNPVPVMVYVRQ